MIVTLVVVVALIGAGLAALFTRRGGSDEVHSVEGYRHTLETLEGMRGRTPAVRVLDRNGQPVDQAQRAGARRPGTADGGLSETAEVTDAGSAARAGTAGRGSGAATPADKPVVFDDMSPAAPLRDTPRGRRRAMSAMNRHPRHLAAPIAVAAVVVALVVGLVIAGADTHRPPAHHAATNPSTSVTAGRGRVNNGHAHGSQATGARGGDGRTHRATPSTTTTTIPTQYAAVQSTANGATYVPPAATYSVTVSTPGGACWVEIVEQSTGNTVFGRTLEPGQAETLTLNGASTVQLGAPTAAAITLDGEAVVLPAGYQTPFTLTFQPGGSAAASTTTSAPPA